MDNTTKVFVDKVNLILPKIIKGVEYTVECENNVWFIHVYYSDSGVQDRNIEDSKSLVVFLFEELIRWEF